MEYRKLGNSGLSVPVLSFGTATFGGTTDFFKAWGTTQVAEAKRLVDVCLDAGVTLFDTANSYSDGASEDILGQAVEGKRDRVLLSTKAAFPTGGKGPNEYGSSRAYLTSSVEKSLKRLRTDYIDLYHIHAFDAHTPIEETLGTLDDLVRAGKIRYTACSNFSGWHLMKSMAISDRNMWTRYAGHQVYYSLVGRELEWELMPAGHDQGVGTIVWSPLAGGALTGKIRRDKPAPKDSRIGTREFVQYQDEVLFRVIDACDEIAKETGKTIAQISLNWLLQRPTVATLVVGARNEEQLKQNLGAIGWKLTPAQMAKLDAASAVKPAYPYWHQDGSASILNPPITPRGF